MRDLLELRPCSVSSVGFEPNPDADGRLPCVAPRTIAGRCELRTFETAQRENYNTPAHFTSFVRVHGHSSLSSRSALHQFGLYLHTPTPRPPPINTNVHPPATSSSHRDKGPCTSHQLAAEITLGATAEVQLNSATDSTSVPRQARLIRKRTRTSPNSTARPAP
jgi:hypothetical protein